jgi:hypothetical protein
MKAGMSYKTEIVGWLRFVFRNSSGYSVAHLGSIARYGLYVRSKHDVYRRLFMDL